MMTIKLCRSRLHLSFSEFNGLVEKPEVSSETGQLELGNSNTCNVETTLLLGVSATWNLAICSGCQR